MLCEAVGVDIIVNELDSEEVGAPDGLIVNELEGVARGDAVLDLDVPVEERTAAP